MQPNLYKKIVKIDSATTNKYDIISAEVRNVAKFADKLAKKRKENNLSQEQLADRLNMSRQAVSKWESGSSYPDMEKIIEITKVLDCTLEDLLDDGTIKGQAETRTNYSDVFSDFLDFITRSYNMFWSMSFKTKLAFMFEMLFIAIALSTIFYMLGGLLGPAIYSFFRFLPYRFASAAGSLLRSVYNLTTVILCILMLLHLYKIRYLDYYVTVKDNSVNKRKVEDPIDENKNIKEDKRGNLIYEKPKEKVIIRDPGHSGYSFFLKLAEIIIIFIKVIGAFFLIPVITVFVAMTAFATLALIMTSIGTVFLTIALSLIGAIIITYIIIEIIVRLLFNKKISWLRLFIMFIAGLIVMGVGTGLSIAEFSTYEIESIYESKVYKNQTITKEYEYKDKLFINFMGNSSTKVNIDNNAQNIKASMTCPDVLGCSLEEHYMNGYYQIHDVVGNRPRFKDLYNIVVDGFKKKKLYVSDQNPVKIEITLSQDDFNKIANNFHRYHYTD